MKRMRTLTLLALAALTLAGCATENTGSVQPALNDRNFRDSPPMTRPAPPPGTP